MFFQKENNTKKCLSLPPETVHGLVHDWRGFENKRRYKGVKNLNKIATHNPKVTGSSPVPATKTK
jgi:hypothetical protein